MRTHLRDGQKDGFAYLSGWSADDGVCHFVMTGCSSSEAVKMPVVIAHQLAPGSALSGSVGSGVRVEKYCLLKQRNMLFRIREIRHNVIIVNYGLAVQS